MIRLTFVAVIIGMLVACSGMTTGKPMSSSSAMNETASMGGPGVMVYGTGPSAAKIDGP